MYEQQINEILSLQQQLEDLYEPLNARRTELIKRIQQLKEGEYDTLNDALLEQNKLDREVSAFNEEQHEYNALVLKYKELTKGLEVIE